ncbi:MAG: sigma-70 family RNA polymerase sigma factor [Vicinamibacterales bacterium]
MEDRAEAEIALGRLMQRAQGGDAAAYTVLLTALTPIVRRMVRARRGSFGADAIEDLVQDTLLSLHAARATYDPSRPLLPWVSAIVRHRLGDAARRDARRRRREQPFDDEQAAGEVMPERRDEGPGDAAALAAAIQALPPGQRQAIELLKLQELSLHEASELTGTSVGALKVATHRAIGALRKALGAGD